MVIEGKMFALKLDVKVQMNNQGDVLLGPGTSNI